MQTFKPHPGAQAAFVANGDKRPEVQRAINRVQLRLDIHRTLKQARDADPFKTQYEYLPWYHWRSLLAGKRVVHNRLS